jgi:hypothetical protein
MHTPEKPRPGSKEAISAGCTCPVMDNCRGAGYMGQKDVFVFSCDCKVHATAAAQGKEGAKNA